MPGSSIIMDNNLYEDEEMLEQYSLMAQAEANVRIRDLTGFSMESYRVEQELAKAAKKTASQAAAAGGGPDAATTSEQIPSSSSSNTTTATSTTLSNLRFTYPGAGSRPQPELPQRRIVLVDAGGGGDGSTHNGNGVNNNNNNSNSAGGTNSKSKTCEPTSSLRTTSRTSSSALSSTSSSSSSFLMVGNSNNHALNDQTSNHQHRSSTNGGGSGNNNNVLSNRPSPKEPSFPLRLVNDRYDQPPRPLEVPELCQGVVVDNVGDGDDDENDHHGDISGHDHSNSHNNDGDMISGHGSSSFRSRHDQQAVHDSNDNTINRSSITSSGDQHHNHHNQSQYHVVPCLSCRSKLRVNVLASLVSCPKCNTVNPAIGSLDNE